MGRSGTSAPPLDRRSTLLDVAASMVAAGDVEGVTVETVATAAGVSRALVYKHFANRSELLAELYRRESQALHEQMAAAVAGAKGLEAMLRALVEGALAAQAARGATLAALAAGGRTPDQRARQRRRDGATVRWFASAAVDELDLDPEVATRAVRLTLRGIAAVLEQWRHQPTPANARVLADTWVAMAVGGLRALAGHPPR